MDGWIKDVRINGNNIVITVEENTTGINREAIITLLGVDVGGYPIEKSFLITQFDHNVSDGDNKWITDVRVDDDGEHVLVENTENTSSGDRAAHIVLSGDDTAGYKRYACGIYLQEKAATGDVRLLLQPCHGLNGITSVKVIPVVNGVLTSDKKFIILAKTNISGVVAKATVTVKKDE